MKTETETKPIESIQDIYDALSRIYSCKFADNRQEMEEAVNMINYAYHNENVTIETFVSKMKQLRKVTDNFQSKLSTHIMNRYWEKTYREKIKRRRITKD